MAALVLLGSAPTVRAAPVKIDFGSSGVDEYPSGAYSEDGYSVAGAGNLWISGYYGNPQRAVVLEFQTAKLTITNLAGKAFKLLSLDYQGDLGPSIRVEGTFSDGGTTSTVSLTPGSDWVTASSFAGFNNLKELRFIWVSGDTRIDNIVLDISEVPLPAALPLLASGLAGIAWLRRRDRKIV